MKRKRLLFGCLFAAILVAVAVGLLELVLRMFMGHVLGPVETRWHVEEVAGGSVALTPGFRGTLTIAGRTCELTTNSDGLRGPELSPRQPGERRVLALGDSLTFGWGVEYDESFPARIGELLAEQRPPVTVLNGGVPGYGTREIALAMERAIPRLGPDVLLACIYVGNDFEDDVVVDKVVVDGFLMARHKAEVARDSWRVRLAMASRVWLLCERLWEKVLPASGISSILGRDAAEFDAAFAGWPTGEQRKDCLFMDAEPPGPVQRAAFDRVGSSLDRMVQLAGDRPLIVVVVPTQWHCMPATMKDLALAYYSGIGLDPAKIRPGRCIEEVGRLAEQRGLPWVDLREALFDPSACFIQGDGHLTIEGNRRAAAAITPFVVRALNGR
ncbi:MAG: hypothetical protein KDB80_14495 [Planctomycetes bacterium]|nr:hypothetical protein [Planctomycetota bacterium]